MRQSHQPTTCFKLLWSDILFPSSVAILQSLVRGPIFVLLHDVPYDSHLDNCVRAGFDSVLIQITVITIVLVTRTMQS
jgi:hypothetical protein